MILKPVKKAIALPKEEPKESPKTVTKKRKEKLSDYSDTYKPMFDPIRFLVSDKPSYKDPTKMTKQYLEISVKRFNDDEALPYVYIQGYQESDFYTGYQKGKCISFPLEMLYTVMEELEALSEECDKRHIE